MTAAVVLVHGAWHGAWCFDRVMPLLHDAGVSAVAVDLPGHGTDPRPFTDLHGDASCVRAVLDGIDGEVVLLGHSYGGAVITEAGVHPSVRRLVYLCALALDTGESCGSAAVAEAAGLSHEGRPSLGDALVSHPDGTSTMTADGAAACLYNDSDAETTAWAVAHLGPQTMGNLGQRPAAVAWRERPSTYVVCADEEGPSRTTGDAGATLQPVSRMAHRPFSVPLEPGVGERAPHRVGRRHAEQVATAKRSALAQITARTSLTNRSTRRNPLSPAMLPA